MLLRPSLASRGRQTGLCTGRRTRSSPLLNVRMPLLLLRASFSLAHFPQSFGWRAWSYACFDILQQVNQSRWRYALWLCLPASWSPHPDVVTCQEDHHWSCHHWAVVWLVSSSICNSHRLILLISRSSCIRRHECDIDAPIHRVCCRPSPLCSRHKQGVQRHILRVSMIKKVRLHGESTDERWARYLTRVSSLLKSTSQYHWIR